MPSHPPEDDWNEGNLLEVDARRSFAVSPGVSVSPGVGRSSPDGIGTVAATEVARLHPRPPRQPGAERHTAGQVPHLELEGDDLLALAEGEPGDEDEADYEAEPPGAGDSALAVVPVRREPSYSTLARGATQRLNPLRAQDPPSAAVRKQLEEACGRVRTRARPFLLARCFWPW
jgi:hypothetical protein